MTAKTALKLSKKAIVWGFPRLMNLLVLLCVGVAQVMIFLLQAFIEAGPPDRSGTSEENICGISCTTGRMEIRGNDIYLNL